MFDEIRLRQILVNLLSNAVRYTRRGEITAEVVWRAQTLAVDITDTGIGIAAAHRDTVFMPFNRGGHAGSKGAGLGLSIVKRMVEQMHGTLAFDSEVGRGSSFRVALPRAKERAAAHADDAIAPRFWLQGAASSSPTTTRTSRICSKALLGDLGFRVRVVDDAQSAVLEAMAGRPDVLLIDVELSGLSGNAAVYKLRSRGYRGPHRHLVGDRDDRSARGRVARRRGSLSDQAAQRRAVRARDAAGGERRLGRRQRCQR